MGAKLQANNERGRNRTCINQQHHTYSTINQ